MALRDGHQPHQRLRVLACGLSAHEEGRRRQDHQYRLDDVDLRGAASAPAYAASKGGIVQFARACATAWAKDNIQVNSILPGWINTDLTQGRAARGAGPERARARRARRPAAGASRRISPASRCFWRARRRTSSPARRSRSMAGSRCRVASGGTARHALPLLVPQPAHHLLEQRLLRERGLFGGGGVARGLFLGASGARARSRISALSSPP